MNNLKLSNVIAPRRHSVKGERTYDSVVNLSGMLIT